MNYLFMYICKPKANRMQTGKYRKRVSEICSYRHAHTKKISLPRSLLGGCSTPQASSQQRAAVVQAEQPGRGPIGRSAAQAAAGREPCIPLS